MNVKELITELLNFPMDSEVRIALEDPESCWQDTRVYNLTHSRVGFCNLVLIQPDNDLVAKDSTSFLISEIKHG